MAKQRTKISILIVADAPFSICDDDSPFSLGKALSALQESNTYEFSWSFLRPEEDPFREDELEQHDQLWLFGGCGDYKLKDSQITAIEGFMAAGGGIFASGDHDRLGYALCGRIPRLRAMRSWDGGYEAEGYGARPEESTAEDGDARVDSRAWSNPFAKVAAARSAADEYDLVAKQVDARWYWYLGAFAPHPIMRNRYRTRFTEEKGAATPVAIKFLPDHHHEGVCLDYTHRADMPPEQDFEGYAWPEVVCDGRSRSGRPLDAYPGVPRSRAYAVVSAFSHPSVGSIVVDSTWHHWITANAGGFLTTNDPQCRANIVGEDCRSYFLNVAEWLVPVVQKSAGLAQWVRNTRQGTAYCERFDLSHETNELPSNAELTHLYQLAEKEIGGLDALLNEWVQKHRPDMAEEVESLRRQSDELHAWLALAMSRMLKEKLFRMVLEASLPGGGMRSGTESPIEEMVGEVSFALQLLRDVVEK